MGWLFNFQSSSEGVTIHRGIKIKEVDFLQYRHSDFYIRDPILFGPNHRVEKVIFSYMNLSNKVKELGIKGRDFYLINTNMYPETFLIYIIYKDFNIGKINY